MRREGPGMSEKCGAKTRSGKPCKHAAGQRTDHPSVGRCWLHGGLTPVKTARYSKVKRRRVGELAAEFEADPDPLNLLPELAQARALYADYLERCEKDPKLWDPGAASKLLAEISKAAKRIEDVRAQNAVSRADFYRVLSEMGRAVDLIASELIDQATRDEFLQRVHDAWMSIRLG